MVVVFRLMALTVLIMLSLTCFISRRYGPSETQIGASGMNSSFSVIKPFKVFGPLVGRVHFKLLLSARMVMDPSIRELPSSWAVISELLEVE